MHVCYGLWVISVNGMSLVQRRLYSILRRFRNPHLKSRQLQQIHAQILTNPNFQSHSSTIDFLSSCARSRDLGYATHFLCSSSASDPWLWNMVIRTYAETLADEGLMYFYKMMLFESVKPDSFTFSLILRQCVWFEADKVGGSVHCQIVKMGFEGDPFLQTGLVDFYGKVSDLDSAKRMFDKMSVRDVVAHNAMIYALSKSGCVDDARKLFETMPERSAASYNSIITCYCKHGDIDSAQSIFNRNPLKNVMTWNAMIDGYCKTEQLTQAQELFDQMGSTKNLVTWNTMISGCVQCREFLRAVSLFQQMQKEKVHPNEVTMVSLLSACAHLGAPEMGIWIHNYIKNHKIKIDVFVGNALVDMYCKCGDIRTALDVFHGLSTRNTYCWSSIIVGLGMHGYGREAIDAFRGMERDGIKPDRVTFIGLLCGCSHSGLVSKGRHYFSAMHSVYGIEPRIEHYGCMMDLLGRAGFLEEALHLIKSMPMKPNAIVLGSLLRACKIHKDTKTSECLTRILLELDPDDGGNYVFLSNVYVSMRRWDEAEICRKAMTEKGVQKIPGCSSIEVNNTVYEFVAGDTSHPYYLQINKFLAEITRKLMNLGYQPGAAHALHNIEEEEKENAIRYHSEKIAIVFGLMSIGQGKPIRIVKNLRVCDDCHSAIKLIAKIFEREIIVRDRNRFHHFQNGYCSCRDYW